jgi:hypothetical protein
MRMNAPYHFNYAAQLFAFIRGESYCIKINYAAPLLAFSRAA